MLRRVLLGAVVSVTVACIGGVGVAAADVADWSEYHWDLYESPTTYGANFTASYSGVHAHSWTVDTAHSTQVRIQRCDGTIVSDYIQIPAHSQSHYIYYRQASGGYPFLNAGSCFQTRAFSNLTTLYNRNGVDWLYTG